MKDQAKCGWATIANFVGLAELELTLKSKNAIPSVGGRVWLSMLNCMFWHVNSMDLIQNLLGPCIWLKYRCSLWASNLI